ncbi:MAG: hypothetical protein ACI4RA_06940 [Kiritimatiellia bacterium]
MPRRLWYYGTSAGGGHLSVASVPALRAIVPALRAIVLALRAIVLALRADDLRPWGLARFAEWRWRRPLARRLRNGKLHHFSDWKYSHGFDIIFLPFSKERQSEQ